MILGSSTPSYVRSPHSAASYALTHSSRFTLAAGTHHHPPHRKSPVNSTILQPSLVQFLNSLPRFSLQFQTIATRLLRRYTHLVDKAKEVEATGKMNKDVFMKKIVPVGLLFSASLVLSNWVYLRLTVSFIQMIKAFTPVSVLLVSAAFKLKELNQKIIAIVCCISLGVAIASYGEVDFELVGFLVQALAIGIESCRLVMVQIMLQGLGLDPLSSLYYMAPVCLVSLKLCLPKYERVGWY